MKDEGIVQYQVKFGHKFFEEDLFDEGCVPGTGGQAAIEVNLTAATREGIVKELMQWCGTEDASAVLLNACGIVGRVDVQLHEDKHGLAATSRDMHDWRHGDLRLWWCDYSFMVNKITVHNNPSMSGALEGACDDSE